MEFFLGAFERDWERRRAALLHQLQMGHKPERDWDWRKKGGAAFLPEARPAGRARPAGWPSLQAGSETGRAMRSRFEALARGSQPAVVKLASYGGSGRVGAMISYAARDGQLAVESDRGVRVSGKNALSALRSEWEHLFDNRADSRDVAVFNVTVGHASFDRRDPYLDAREMLKAGLGDRRFVFAIDKGAENSVAIRGVTMLRDPTGERLTGDGKAAEIVQQRFDDSQLGGTVEARFRFHWYGNGIRFATARVRDLVGRFDGEVRDETGRLISTPQDAGNLVQKDWRHEMHSRKGRDVMHLIVSARPGTDLAAFQDAVRDFLGERFAGHRYIFAVHDPSDDPRQMVEGGKRPHIHAHAIITLRSDIGERVVTSPRVFRAWRELMAEKAREHGINMELTDRRDQASPPAYARNQVRPVSYAGRTEHEGTSQAAQARYDAKRENIATSATAERSRPYVVAAAAAWRELSAAAENKELANFAQQHFERMNIASSLIEHNAEFSASTTHRPSNKVLLRSLIEIEKAAMKQMSRPEFEAYQKRIETVLSGVEANIEPWERHDYDEIATAARDVVSIRREYLELSEGEVTTPPAARPEADNEAWGRAIARHGEQVVERGNDAMLATETVREAINRTPNEGRYARNANRDRATEANARNSDGMDDPTPPGAHGRMVPPVNVAQDMAGRDAARQADPLRDAESERILAESRARDDQVPDGVDRLPSKAPAPAQRTSGPVGRESSAADPPRQQVLRLRELEREIRKDGERER
ncbi:relaxase/mobilization nuclease domain-containing protein [Mesorhizobium qingshengii]|uniref:MobA/VirD2-like nuclease domain-containing protein n=1 Tax=Mesorhizobium qingshengii TaxID=1165689 RepID=A0A1G5ZPR8_9HYPH|nr:hypothetical protein [Mesorhizobium qingshengii]SDA96560.1 hypothetical protein SAMN02927914_05673 [Mesorhizobium qingshengii]